jgi:hypothetical protein
MNRIKLGFIALVVTLLAACNTNPVAVQGTLTGQDFGTATVDLASDVAVPQGSGVGAIVVGQTFGSLDGPNKGDYDGIIRKYDGGVVWANQFGTRQRDFTSKVAVTGAGSSYVLGQTNGALGFKVGDYDVFVRKYDANGVVQWTRQFGTPGYDSARDIALDSSGNIYVLGFDATPNRPVVRKFNDSGTLLLTFTVNTFVSYSPALAVDSTGNIFVLTQYFSGSSYFARIFKYNSAGTLVASPNLVRGVGVSTGFLPLDLEIDSSDNLYFSLFDNGTNKGAYLYKYTNALVRAWFKRLEPAATGTASFPLALAVDSSNNVYVAGTTTGAYPGSINAGDNDIFVLKYSSAGTRLWTRQFGATDYDSASGIAVSEVVYVAGVSFSNPNLLGDPSYCGCTTSGDAFLAQLDSATGAVLGIDQ